MKVSTPFNFRVPKELRANLRWRREVYRRAVDDKEFAQKIWEACAADPLFFVNGFCWTYNSKEFCESPKRPFILYEFQELALLDLIRAIGEDDRLIEKSRQMGASWLCITAFFWCWLFKPKLTFLFVSRVEDCVDQAGNPKSMMWKMDYLLDNLPLWLHPIGYKKSDHRKCMHIENPENGSVIDGESTNKDIARGDNRTAILLDEFAAVEQNGYSALSATRDATRCRIFNSTPRGATGAFYDMSQGGIKKMRMHWSAHPLKNIGLYTKTDGKYEILDKEYWATVDDPVARMRELDAKIIARGVPLPDGKLRSPWYACECERAGSAQEIAQEVDIDYLGSGHQFFTSSKIQGHITKYARKPLYVGDLEYDPSTGDPVRFVPNPEGNLKVWVQLDKEFKPSRDSKYSTGQDISAGMGASNSCYSAFDIKLCDKAVEYVNPYIRPEQFAEQSVAISRWLNNAYMIWEQHGPGRGYGARIIEMGYGNIYMRCQEEAISKKVSDIPGWVPTKESKLLVVGMYREAVEDGDCINYSQTALEETLEYVHDPQGGVMHARSKSKVDPSGARENHGDRVIADALAWKGVHDRAVVIKEETPKVPYGCLRWRNDLRKKEKEYAGRDGW